MKLLIPDFSRFSVTLTMNVSGMNLILESEHKDIKITKPTTRNVDLKFDRNEVK